MNGTERNLAREKRLQHRGALPMEEGVIVREYKAMHEEIFLGSWLREDAETKRGKKEGKQGDQRTSEQKEEKRRGERRGRNGGC